MAEYIERDSAINAVYESFADGKSPYGALISIPAADVRPVVLCRDCVLRRYCNVAQYLGADGFCSNAVKRDEEGE